MTTLDNEATYLGQLGQNVTNVGQLWSLAVMQVDGLTPDPILASVADLNIAVPGQIGLDFVRSYAEPISSRERSDHSAMDGPTTGSIRCPRLRTAR